MKKGLPILLMAMLLWAGLNAQTRYLDEVFTTVDNDSTDILYGMNIGIISGYPVPTGFVLTDAGMAGMPGDTSLVGNVVYQEPAFDKNGNPSVIKSQLLIKAEDSKK